MEKVEGSDGPSAAADREAMAALGVLHFLSLENLRDANELWRKYSSEVREQCFACLTAPVFDE